MSEVMSFIAYVVLLAIVAFALAYLVMGFIEMYKAKKKAAPKVTEAEKPSEIEKK